MVPKPLWFWTEGSDEVGCGRLASGESSTTESNDVRYWAVEGLKRRDGVRLIGNEVAEQLQTGCSDCCGDGIEG